MKKILLFALILGFALALTSCEALFPPSEQPHEHKWSAATCLEAAKCTCGATDGEPLGHKMSSATCENAPKCQNEGCDYTEGDPLGHKMSAPTCVKLSSCENEGCEHTEGELGTHRLSLKCTAEDISFTCDYCSSSFSLDNAYLLDGSGYDGIEGNKTNQSYTATPDTYLPIITENGEYQLLNTSGERAQLQLWLPAMRPKLDGFSAENKAVGFLSFRLNSRLYEGFSMRLVDTSSTGDRWSADWCITNSIFSISELYVSKASREIVLDLYGLNTEKLCEITVDQDTFFTGWIDVAMGIVLSSESDTVTVHYYVNGEFVGSHSTALTTLTDAVNSVYVTGYTVDKDSGILFDDVVFGYTSNSEWIFDITEKNEENA